MQELKELKLDTTKQEINQMVNSWKRETPFGLSKKEFFDIRNELLEYLSHELEISLFEKKIYATGHQPDVHHPGILSKDITLFYLLDSNSVGLHFIVDTDYFEFEYFYPLRNGKNAELHQFSAHSHSTFEGEKVEDCKRSELVSILKSQRSELEFFLNKKVLDNAFDCINKYIQGIESKHLLHKINEEIQSEFLESKEILIYKFPVSKLIRSKAFLIFVDLIRKRQKEFVEIHNLALETYRKEHKIKNHAQPLPNLATNEMPFWEYRNHERVCFGVNEFPSSILPRAITLTLFLRIFLCDFFIHGKGGARYEQISETIANQFFKIEPCPYQVVTATMNLSPNVNFELPKYEQKELERKLREIEYSPEHFLNSEHPLVKEKKKFLKEFQNPSSNKKELHFHITKLNQEMKQELFQLEKELKEELELIEIKNKTKKVFETRNFPFFYYHLDELSLEIQKRLFKD